MRINGSGNNSCKLKFKEQSLIDRNPHQVIRIFKSFKGYGRYLLLLFCHKGKQNEHVTRPSTVNPPSDDEKVNVEMGIQIMVEVFALGEMQAIKQLLEKLKAVAALKPLQEKLEEEFSMEIDRKVCSYSAKLL
ncbi:oxysterol-binding protein-related protein 1D [Tanacetum coccineum]